MSETPDPERGLTPKRRPDKPDQESEPPAIPYNAPNALLDLPAVRRLLLGLIALLVVIEAVLFFAPKVGWVFAPEAEWTSLSPLRNPLRQSVFEEHAFHSLRDTGIGTDEISTLQSLKPVAKEAREALPRSEVDVFDCAYPWAYAAGGYLRRYKKEGCAIARDWLIETGNYTEVQPRYHTIVTSTFLHVGLLHMALNCLALFFLGRLAMLRMGPARFMAFFICAGIIGFLVHAGFRGYLRGSLMPIVGASGAIMGCLGLHWRILYERAKRRSPAHVPKARSAGTQLRKQIFAFLWADLLFIITASFISGEAHIGGLFFGFLIGPLFMRSPDAQRSWLRSQRSAPLTSASIPTAT